MTAMVIVVMTAVSIPAFAPRYRAYQMRAAAWQIAGDMRLARQRAVTTRNRYRFVFVADGDPTASAATSNTYVIQYRTQQGAVWIQETPPTPGARKAVPTPVHIATSSTPRTRAVTFNANGSVVPTGTIQLRGPGGTALSVTVDQAGRVQVK